MSINTPAICGQAICGKTICGQTVPVLSSIQIVTPPDKMTYDIGEFFDPTGMIMQARYSDGHTENITDFSCSPTRKLRVTDQEIKITYMGFAEIIPIEVISDHPYKGVYINDIESNFVRVTKINGELPDYAGEPIEVNLPGGFEVEVDLAGYLRSIGASVDNYGECSLCLFGKVYYTPDVKCSVYAVNSNKKICDVHACNSSYYIPLKKVYAETGSFNFRLFIENPVQYLDKNSDYYQENYPHEIFSIRQSQIFVECDFGNLISLNIDHAANKKKYLVGETFNTAGLSVSGTYEFGAVRSVSYTVEPNRTLRISDTFVEIKSGDVSVKHAVEIEGQHLSLTAKKYIKRKESGVWGDWSEDSSVENITVSKSDTEEVKTVITFNKSTVLLGNKKRTGLRFLLERSGTGSQSGVSHIKVNGIEHTLPTAGKSAYLYIGNVHAGDSGVATVEFEYADENAVFPLGNNPAVYYCDSLDPALKSEKKEFSLSGGVRTSVDLLHGGNTLSFNDIAADSNLLGVNISHVFTPTDGNAYYGENYRLNLYERLEISKAPDGPISTPIYTDAAGNKYAFTVVYYRYENEEVKYLTTEEIKDLTYDSDNNLVLYGSRVYYGYAKAGGFRYLPSIVSTITNNTRYQAMLNQSGNEPFVPVHWLKKDNLYKGFGASGLLVLTIDEYNNYIEFIYDYSFRIARIEDGKGNYLNFTYSSSSKNLQKIESSRGRRIEYAYNGSSLASVSYYDALTGGENYKTLNFSYIPVTLDGIDTYAVSEIVSSDKSKTTMEYEQYSDYAYRLSKITRYSAEPTATDIGSSLQKVSSFTFGYDYECLSMVVTDDDFNEERYVFDENGITKEYYQICNNLVSKAEYTDYTPYERQEKLVIADKLLNKYSYEEFQSVRGLCVNGSFECSICEGNCNASNSACRLCTENCLKNYNRNVKTVTELNGYNLPVRVTQSNVYLTDTASKTIVTEYEYDDALNTTLETCTETYSNGKRYKTVTSYTYDSSTGRLIKKESVVYHMTGRSFEKEVTLTEEYEYDENGCVSLIKNYRKEGNYTTTDNVYYTQKEYNANKQQIKEYDETGLNPGELGYINGTNLVSYVKQPNGNTVYYNYDNEDRVAKLWATSQGTENANTTEYTAGEIEKLNHSGNNAIEYEYDHKRRPVKVKTGGAIYETYEYEDDVSVGWYFGNTMTVTNAKGERFKAEADAYGHFERAYYNGKLILQRNYDNHGRLWNVVDNIASRRFEYSYDTCGNVTGYTEKKSGNLINGEDYRYNGKGQPVCVIYEGEAERTDVYTYAGNAVDYVKKVETGDYISALLQDIDERYKGKTVQIGEATVDSEIVSYIKEGSHATRCPNRIQFPDVYLRYFYDRNGNIMQIMHNGILESEYTYDAVGRLVRENNQAFGESYFYSYDNNGNILTKEKCAFTTSIHTPGTGMVTSYTYDKDRMTAFGGQSCVYDSVGNPTTYRGKTAVWARGRKLVSYNGATFEYDAQGRRIKKNSIEYIYDSQGRLLKQSNGLEFFYDTTGLLGFTYAGNKYVYRKDIQGNIIAVLDSAGTLVVQYEYDAWGNVQMKGNTNIGNLNPFRYRSYYFDTETGFYFLKTRYYDPEVGRFINIDSLRYVAPETINGLNLFAYCGNNPVMGYDPEGTWNWGKFFASVIVVALVVVAVVATAGAAAIPATAVGASIATTALELTAAAATGAAINGMISIENQRDEEFSWGRFGVDLGTGAVNGIITYGAGKILGYMGESFGFALSESYFNGVKIGSIFSSGTLSALGKFGGGLIGSIGAGVVMDKCTNDVWGTNNSIEELLSNNIVGDIISRLIEWIGSLI